jgi:hypothetical protein
MHILVYPGRPRVVTHTIPAPKCESIYNVKLNGIVRTTLTVK